MRQSFERQRYSTLTSQETLTEFNLTTNIPQIIRDFYSCYKKNLNTTCTPASLDDAIGTHENLSKEEIQKRRQ
jgi:hypothetical protein